MSLLFDKNISFRVAKKIQDIFPGAKHISDLQIEGYFDIEIWNYARVHSHCIVTFDLDFIDISALKGFPPKIIWLRTGNTSTENLITKIRSEAEEINAFLANEETGFLEIK